MRAWHDEQADWNVVAADTGDRRQALDRASSIPAPRTFYQGVSGAGVTPWAGRARGRGAHGGGQGRLRGVVDSFFLARTFVTLLVITDPVGTVPVFISMTTTVSGRERNRAAWQAVLVAGLVIATFALFGQQILLYLDISLPSLQAAGGLLLLVVALDLLRGDVGALAGGSTTNIAFVPLGTPLLAGPGAIAAVMVFARQADRPDERLGVALGLVGVLAVLYLSLRFSGLLLRVLRQAGVDLITRISGLLLTAIAVELIVDTASPAVRPVGRSSLQCPKPCGTDRAGSGRRRSKSLQLVHHHPDDGGMADTGLTGTAGRIADLQSSHPWRPAAKTATPRRPDTGLVHRTGRPRGPGRSGAPGRRSGPPGAPRQCHPRPPQPRYPWRRLPRVLRVPPPTWRRWQADPGLSSAECRQIRPVADAFVLVTGLQGCLEPWKL